ncbi:MAG: MarR family transcriptional regulator [Terriglobales bacterium]
MATRALRSVGDGRDQLRLWLRLLACTNLIESRVRSRLRVDFDTTLPRFDMLAQLDAASANAPQGITMGELSRRLMVTNGNLTGLTERLVQEGLVRRKASAKDRREQRVALTAQGKRALATMVVDHKRWIDEMFSGLNAAEVLELYRLVGRLKDSVQSSAGKEAL